MTVNEAITRAGALTGIGSVISTSEMVKWLSAYDGTLARDFFGASEWTEYDAADAETTTLLVLHPWDELYVHHLEAMSYFSTGEYQRSENAKAAEFRLLSSFKANVVRKYGPPDPDVLEEITDTGE